MMIKVFKFLLFLINIITIYDESKLGNLPVGIAIQKFESLNAKRATATSPSNGSGGSLNLTRTSTLNSGNNSPTQSNTVNRHNSVGTSSYYSQNTIDYNHQNSAQNSR